MASTYDDKTLQEAFASLADGARPGDACPLPEQIWAAIAGEIPVDERHRLVDHIATCPSCAEDWRAAYRMGARPPAWWKVSFRSVWKTLHRGPRWVPQASGVLAAAAALVLVLSVTWGRMWTPGPGPDGKPGETLPERGSVFRGIEASIPPEEALSRERCWLRWVGQEGARYDLIVKTESLQLVSHVTGLKKSEYLLSEESLRTVPTGERLLWMVEATLPTGEHITSKAFVTPLK